MKASLNSAVVLFIDKNAAASCKNLKEEPPMKYSFWFVVGSQFLYGPEVLETVARRWLGLAVQARTWVC